MSYRKRKKGGEKKKGEEKWSGDGRRRGT